MAVNNHKEFKHEHHHNEQNVKYRSIVSSISFDMEKMNMNPPPKYKWTHIGENISRLPPIAKKFCLVCKCNISQNNGIHSITISPKGRMIAIGLSTGEIQLRRLSTLPQNELSICLREPKKDSEINSTITCLRFLPNVDNDILLSSDLSGQIDMIHTDKKCIHTMTRENPNEINSIDVNSTGSRIVSGGKDALLRVYDAYTGKIVVTTKPFWKRNLDSDDSKYHKLRIYCIRFHPENCNIFFSGGLDGYVKMWDLREPLQSVRTIKGPCIHGDAMDLRGNILLTGSWQSSKSIDIWDTTSGKLIENLEPLNRITNIDAEYFECVKFFNGIQGGSMILCGGSGSGKFEIYNLTEKRIEFSVPVQDVNMCKEYYWDLFNMLDLFMKNLFEYIKTIIIALPN